VTKAYLIYASDPRFADEDWMDDRQGWESSISYIKGMPSIYQIIAQTNDYCLFRRRRNKDGFQLWFLSQKAIDE
jgi:hypothetical protein